MHAAFGKVGKVSSSLRKKFVVDGDSRKRFGGIVGEVDSTAQQDSQDADEKGADALTGSSAAVAAAAAFGAAIGLAVTLDAGTIAIAAIGIGAWIVFEWGRGSALHVWTWLSSEAARGRGMRNGRLGLHDEILRQTGTHSIHAPP